MRYRYSLLFIVLNLLCVPFVCAQKDTKDIPPAWAGGYYKELPNSYVEVVSATASSRTTAREKALLTIVERRNLVSGARFDVRISDEDVIVTGNDNLTVKARVIDEYARYECNEWTVSLLVQTCKNPMYTYETVNISDKYPLSVKTFLPGMMQLKKDQTAKGLIIIGAEVAMAGGIVAFETLRSSYVSKIKSSHNASARMDYINSANTCSDLRNICIAGAAAVYIWNFIDAIASRGPRYLIIADAAFSVSPCAGFEYMGLALNVNF